jgi:hypothetical protein
VRGICSINKKIGAGGGALEKQKHINQIIDLLSFLKSKVQLSNSINLTDINVISENFYRDFFNKLYGYNLTNINIEEKNAAAIGRSDEITSAVLYLLKICGSGS